MRITQGQLKRIMKEEVARALLEADVINADTGEVITLTPELEGEYEEGQELSNAEFEALRGRAEAGRPDRRRRSRWSPDEDTNAAAGPYPGSPSTATALERLKLLAREAADDWRGFPSGSARRRQLQDGTHTSAHAAQCKPGEKPGQERHKTLQKGPKREHFCIETTPEHTGHTIHV